MRKLSIMKYKEAEDKDVRKKSSDNLAENVELLKKIRELSLEWILSSTCHGLPSIFRTSQIYLKLIWLFFFLASTAGCFYIIINYIITFFEYGVDVNTLNVIETPINFPAVTICNLNIFNQVRASAFTNNALKDIGVTNLTSIVTNTTTAFAVFKAIIFNLKLEATSNPKYSLNRTSYGFYIDEMLISCSYSSSICTSSDFSLLQSYDYGNCYTFNGFINSSTKTTSTAGPGYSLEIELFSGDPAYDIYNYKRGFYVVVHNQTATPIMDNEGVFASIGMETNIGVERRFYLKEASPYSNCVEDPTLESSSSSDLYKLILTRLGEKRYRQAYCYKMCYQIAVVNNCSCYDATYANTNATDFSILACHDGAKLQCMFDIRTIFSETGWNGECSDLKCPIECEQISYKTSVHTTSYPSSTYLQLLLQQSSLISKYSSSTKSSPNFSSYVSSSIAKINVFYSDISYDALIESPSITWDVLLGNIGGSLGLFLGMSFLTVIELFEITLEIIRTLYIHRKQKKISNKI